MNKRYLFIALTFPLIFVLKLNMSHYNVYQTSLLPGIFIQDKNSDLISNKWSAPIVIDWNSDGKKDLLIGNKASDKNGSRKGFISFYQNKGTESNPVFNDFSYITTCSDSCSALTVTPDG